MTQVPYEDLLVYVRFFGGKLIAWAAGRVKFQVKKVLTL